MMTKRATRSSTGTIKKQPPKLASMETTTKNTPVKAAHKKPASSSKKQVKAKAPSSRISKRVTKSKAIVPTKLDAVFGRGRKKSGVRSGSLYRSLIEKHWEAYSNMDSANFAKRKQFVKIKIIDVVLERKGRFIMRTEGQEMYLLDPAVSEDLKLVYKKIQRALFNERKRREEFKGRSFTPTIFEEDDEELESQSKASVNSDLEDDLEEEEEEKEESMDSDTTKSCGSVSEPDLVSADDMEEESEVELEEEDIELEEEDMSVDDPSSKSGTLAESDAGLDSDEEEELELVTEKPKTSVSIADLEVASEEFDTKSYEERRRSSVKLDSLAALATELLQQDPSVGGTPKPFLFEEDDMSSLGGSTSNNAPKTFVASPMAEIPAPVPMVQYPVSFPSSTPLKKRKPRTAFQDLSAQLECGKIDPVSPNFNQTLLDSLRMQPRVGIFDEYFSEDRLWSGAKNIFFA